METAYTNKHLISGLPLKEVMITFFKDNSPDKVQALFWKFFQCWVIKDCKIKAEISDEELALFLDQLNELIAAAYNTYQENGFVSISQEGNSND
jgi:hypothetical protein